MPKRKQFRGVSGPRQLGSNYIIDLPVIRRIARQHWDDDWDFRTYLKCECDLSGREIDNTVRALTDELLQHIDCTTCASCCRTLDIVVTEHDIERLAKRLGLTTEDFAAKYVVMDEDNEQILKSQPCVFLGDDGKCSVYEDRPDVCRGYPYLHEEGFVSRTMSVIGRTADCPIVFNVWHRLKRDLRD